MIETTKIFHCRVYVRQGRVNALAGNFYAAATNSVLAHDIAKLWARDKEVEYSRISVWEHKTDKEVFLQL